MARRSVWPILAGLLAGSITAIVASLVSLPLHSPDDVLANSASVTIVTLVVGMAAGLLWRHLGATAGAHRRFLLYAGGGLGIAVALLVVVELTQLSRAASFGVPLAVIIFGGVAWLTPWLTARRFPTWAPLAAVVAAMAVGGMLAGQGDAASGDLTLDDVVTTTAGSPGTGSSTSTPTSATDVLGRLAAAPLSFEGGTATWTVPETLASFGSRSEAVGRSEELGGTIDVAGSSELSVDLTSFTSDQNRRDQRVRMIFAADPLAVFTTDSLRLPEDYMEGEIFTTRITGDLTVNGTTNPVTWDIEARITGATLEVTGELDIVLTDFGVTPPSIAGVVTVEDSAHLEVLFSVEL